VIHAEGLSSAEVRAEDRRLIWHSWTAQDQELPLAVAGGEGSWVWDFEGERYLDFSSQLVNTNLGHQHPAVIAAIRHQAAILTTAAPTVAVASRNQAAASILDVSPDHFEKVFFTGGGTDAVENAIRMARGHTGRRKVLSAYRSYHGNTGISIAATGDPRRIGNEFATDHVHFFRPHPYRSSFWSESPEQETTRALEHLRQVIEFEGGESIAAVLLETVLGSGGVVPPTPGYLPGVRRLCDEFGIQLILDEVMVGFARTGSWWAFEHYDVVPDLVTFAKGVNSGYVPLGGVLVPGHYTQSFTERNYPGGLTYMGHPLACASAVASIRAMHAEGVVAHAAALGHEVLGPGLRDLRDRFEVVGDVRGIGAFWALEFVTGPDSRAPVPAAQVQQLGRSLLQRGILALIVANRLHVAPPCNITGRDAQRGIALIADAVSEVWEG